ncbi:MAG TPA: metal-dependent transcriptional regulator [Kiritimatiellia bacterium]|nr:metal-dependent transcriptional regulator [Kiritimatiellia bacterium]HMP34894.1 metal-dependent transcriptional regulator [Kiritimatiellia bacterium]
MPTSTVEDYIKQVYLIQQDARGGVAPMGRISEALGITPGTTTTMIKALADDHLVVYEPRVGVRLTDTGEQLALKVLRRHRIAEAFLVKVLGMDWSEVHEDAERLEHAISDKVLDRMDALLNRPTHDPHGDPIPANDGAMSPVSTTCLATATEGARITIARINDQSPRFLSYARSVGLIPGAVLQVMERCDPAESITVRFDGSRKTLSLSARVAGKIDVR